MNLFIGPEIEITHINHLVKSIGILFHHQCEPYELMLPEFQEKTGELLRKAIKYLRQEGFIFSEKDYIIHMGGIAHPTVK